jgi:iron(III) transport system ATP-binding protein
MEMRNITKTFGRFIALDDVSFGAKRGEFICILGPSGCGKTTLLRIVAGLDRQDSGTIVIDAKDFSNIPVSRRNIGIVFQSYALFPNLTAEQNIAYGLGGGFRNRSIVRDRVAELLQLVGLQGMGMKYPAQLSGGQQQRVALARAIAGSPSLLLLDEPLSALDAKVRIRLRSEIRQLQQALGVTTLMVTHDQEEALAMADRILVIDRGKLLQAGTPSEIYDNPANPFVASFIGSMNFIHDAVKESPGVYRKGKFRLVVNEANRLPQGAHATLAIRPEDVLLLTGDNQAADENTIPALVKHLEYKGSNYRVMLRLSENGDAIPVIEAEIPTERIRRLKICESMRVHVDLPVDRLRIYTA